jgi:hypothetical protein
VTIITTWRCSSRNENGTDRQVWSLCEFKKLCEFSFGVLPSPRRRWQEKRETEYDVQTSQLNKQERDRLPRVESPFREFKGLPASLLTSCQVQEDGWQGTGENDCIESQLKRTSTGPTAKCGVSVSLRGCATSLSKCCTKL